MTRDEIIKGMHAEGYSFRQIAMRNGWSYWAVLARAKDMGLERHIESRSRITRAAVLPHWIKGLPIRDIAEALGVPQSTLTYAIHRLNLPPREMQRGRPASRPSLDEDTRQPEPPVPPGIVGELISTKGRWADLAKVAERHGWNSTKAQQEYHRARAVR
jgi:transposase